MKSGEPYSYKPRVVRSLGDLRCKNYTSDKIYWAGYWNIEQPKWLLPTAPAWLKLNAETGELFGTPTPNAPVLADIVLRCEIDGVGVGIQGFNLRVAK